MPFPSQPAGPRAEGPGLAGGGEGSAGGGEVGPPPRGPALPARTPHRGPPAAPPTAERPAGARMGAFSPVCHVHPDTDPKPTLTMKTLGICHENAHSGSCIYQPGHVAVRLVQLPTKLVHIWSMEGAPGWGPKTYTVDLSNSGSPSQLLKSITYNTNKSK